MTQPKLHSHTTARCLKIIFLFFCTWWLITPAALGSERVQPVSKRVTVIPFTMLTGGVLILHAAVGNHTDSLNFIFDTGSGGISLDSTTVDEFNLPVTPSDRLIRGIAGIRKVSFVMGETLHLPGVDVDSLDFHINDYSILTSVYGIRIDGIVGFSLLRRYIVKINYNNFTIEIWTQGSMKYPKKGFLLKPQMHTIPVVPAVIADATQVRTRYFFDTGAGLCLLLTEQMVKDSALFSGRKKIINTQGEGLGGKKLMRLTTLKEVKLGPYRFRHVPVHIFEDEFDLTSYPVLGGLVGNDLLRRFNLVLNYAKREIHLSPNEHFLEAFDYSYTGLGIYLVEGNIIVEDVIADSPGERAGFKPGDIILSVGNNFSRNIQAYKAQLQIPNARLKIIVQRGEELVQLTLRVESIR